MSKNDMSSREEVEGDTSTQVFRHSSLSPETRGNLYSPLHLEATNIGDEKSSQLSYFDFLSANANYRWFIISYLITHFGEWLTYIASIDFIETIRKKQNLSTSRTSLSVLILVRLLPNVFMSAVGGTLADSLDRRHVMIGLDICGALCAGLFLFAYQLESIGVLFGATVVQQCIAGLYDPSHAAIVPQLVDSDAQLKIASTLEGLTWSSMQAFGAATSAIIVQMFGIRMCFLIDGASYFVSALVLSRLRGSFRVTQEAQERDNMTDDVISRSSSSASQRTYVMVMESIRYLQSSYFAALIFLKGTAALGFGACDILSVAFSEDESNTTLLISPNEKVGILFSLVGVGCWLGPMVADRWVQVEQPRSLQLSCIVGFGLSMIGYFGWATIPSFWSVCIFSVIRAAGSSNIWIHSTLLLQKFTVPHMMGRVLAADHAIALICEAVAAYTCGVFMDHHIHWTSYDVSLVLAALTTCSTTSWTLYHLAGRGACQFQDTKITIDTEECEKCIEKASESRKL